MYGFEASAIEHDLHSINAAQLLENLTATGDKEPPSGLDGIAFQNVAPSASSQRVFVRNYSHDILVGLYNIFVAHGMLVKSSQDSECLIGAIVRCQPSWSLWDDEDYDEHSNKEDALENHGNSPGERLVCRRSRHKTVVDPINKENSEVQGGELGADKDTSGGFWCELCHLDTQDLLVCYSCFCDMRV